MSKNLIILRKKKPEIKKKMSSENIVESNRVETDNKKLTIQNEQENENQNNEMAENDIKTQEAQPNETTKMESKMLIIILSIISLIFLILTIIFLVLYVKKDDDDDEETTYEQKEQNIKTSKGQNIYGILYLPKKKNSYSVIFCHGFGVTHKDNQEYAEYLAKYGYVTFIFDFRGGGMESKSDGKMTDMTPLTEKEDLGEVYNFLIEQEYTSKEKVFLVGNSQGGFVSSLYAADNKDNIAGLLLFFPALVIPDNMRQQFPDLSIVPTIITNYLFGNDIGKVYIESVYTMNAYEYLKGYDKQVIILHGIEDSVVHYSSSVKACENYGTTCRLILYEGGDHGLNGEVPRKKSLQDTLHYFNDLVNGVF